MSAPRKQRGKNRNAEAAQAPAGPPSVNDIQKANGLKFEGRNPRQKFHYRSIRQNQVTVALGYPGTGKTYVSVVAACELFLRGEIDRIVIVRPAVAAGGEEHGFLPGDIGKKLAPWARPVIDIIGKCIGAERLRAATAAGLIEAMPFTYMRGLTFDRAFVILDEAQNTTPEQIRLFTQRMGEDVRVVIDGDIMQCDLKGDSGLDDLLDVLPHIEGISVGVVEYEIGDIERGPITAAFARAWEVLEDDAA